MRAHFGDALFVRTIAGMEPTPRAKGSLHVGRVILRERAMAWLRAGFEPSASEREFAIATTDPGAAA